MAVTVETEVTEDHHKLRIVSGGLKLHAFAHG